MNTVNPEADLLMELTVPTALEQHRVGLASLIDIRQSFELDIKGTVPGAVHIPFFEVKRMLGHELSEDEQEILDAGRPQEVEVAHFFGLINQLYHAQDRVLLCLCNSGRRSLLAATLLRQLGYRRVLSVAGGFQAWKALQV